MKVRTHRPCFVSYVMFRGDADGGIDQDPLLHLLHLGGNPLIRTIRIRPPSPKCEACGLNASIRVDEYDYDTFCAGPSATDPDENDNGAIVEEVLDRIGAKVSLES